MSDSIFSHEEHSVARMLADGMTTEKIADERGVSPESVERSVDRIREKTTRAFATLAESPFAAEMATELDEDTRRALSETLGQ